MNLHIILLRVFFTFPGCYVKVVGFWVKVCIWLSHGKYKRWWNNLIYCKMEKAGLVQDDVGEHGDVTQNDVMKETSFSLKRWHKNATDVKLSLAQCQVASCHSHSVTLHFQAKLNDGFIVSSQPDESPYCFNCSATTSIVLKFEIKFLDESI